MLKEKLYIFLSGIVAGLFIAIGATVNLAILNAGGNEVWAKIVGALFFGIGLYLVIQFSAWLYTGKVGFTFDHKPNFLLDLLICFVGNIVGAMFLSFIVSVTRSGSDLMSTASSMVAIKQADSWYSILLLSFGCGIMVYLAVKGHQVCPFGVGKLIIVFLCVATFILCGFEHIIANVAYYTYARFFDAKALGYFALMLVGNSIGSIFIDGIIRLCESFKPKETK